MAEREQVLLERGFVLHQRPYRDSSQLLECMTAEHGRMGLVARGSRRATTRQRALLQPFVPLRLSWVRRGELGRLTQVEADGASYALEGQRLLAGYYANELLLRLTARGDPNGEVFSCYSRCLAQLGGRARAWRERCAFSSCICCARSATGSSSTATRRPASRCARSSRYVYELEHGLRRAELEDSDADVYSGPRSDRAARADARRRGQPAHGAAAARHGCCGRISAIGRCRAGSCCRTS